MVRFLDPRVFSQGISKKNSIFIWKKVELLGGRKFVCSFPTFHKEYSVLNFDYFYALLWLF
jgi:hypothetical protein